MATQIVEKTVISNGAGNYTSLDNWEDNLGGTTNGNLVSEDEIAIAVCSSSDGTDDTAPVQIFGWTTGASNYIYITGGSAVPAGGSGSGDFPADGIWDDSAYVLYNNDASEYMLDIYENYVRIDHIQFSLVQSSTNNRTAIHTLLIDALNDVRVGNCIFKASVSGTGYVRGAYINDADNIAQIYNCIFFDLINGGNTLAKAVMLNGGTATIRNCTFYNCYNAATNSSGTMAMYNSAVAACSDDIVGTITVDYNVTDDADARGANGAAPSGGDWDNEFTNKGAGNFALVAGGNCVEGGSSALGGGYYSDDIIGTTRS